MIDHAKVSDIHERVFDLPEPERRAEVRRLAAGNAEIEAEVNALLDESSRVESSRFLATPVLGDHLLIAESESEAGPAPYIAGYELGEWLGRGSAGTVYRARMLGPIPREVAVKILHPGLPSSVVSRFHREQRVLASLNHPGVAKVYDAGRTADGREYAAVEFIDGPTITAFAREARLDWRDAVRLMLPVCEAVQDIHASGVLHRDLKPANILVARSAAGPAPKVIDFGAATSLGSQALLASRDPRFVGTIAYMAPEQLDGTPSADARSDVYALGLILAEILLGRHPFDADSAGLVDLIRRITEGRLPELPRSIGADRGELAAVLAKACRVSPGLRYRSPQHLADDLRRVLERRPIEARPPSPMFVARAAVSRRPWTAAASGLALVLVGVLVASLAAFSARNAEQNRRMRDTVNQLVDGVLGELGQLDGTHAVRRDLADLLLRRFDEIPPGGAEHIARRARVIEALGDVAFAAGDFPAARRWREQVVTLSRPLAQSRPQSAEYFDAYAIARIKLGDAINRLGERDLAYAIYQEVHTDLERRLEADPTDDNIAEELTWSYERLIPFYFSNDLDRALALAEKRLAAARTLAERYPASPIHRYGLACAEDWMARLLLEYDRPEDALPHTDAATTLLDRLVAEEPSRYWFRDRHVGSSIQRARILALVDPTAARHALHRAVALARAFYADNPTASLAADPLKSALSYAADVADTIGDPGLAAELRREWREMHERAASPPGP